VTSANGSDFTFFVSKAPKKIKVMERSDYRHYSFVNIQYPF